MPTSDHHKTVVDLILIHSLFSARIWSFFSKFIAQHILVLVDWLRFPSLLHMVRITNEQRFFSTEHLFFRPFVLSSLITFLYTKTLSSDELLLHSSCIKSFNNQPKSINFLPIFSLSKWLYTFYGSIDRLLRFSIDLNFCRPIINMIILQYTVFINDIHYC